ncbi:protoheme IX farnesyltransferase, mitochondrial [Impatiens glandulifera]|uniref:protoheme IX farnesyltransferase, mitochondrial n=1 Tax=Impatiens glandulifera TaxID=253017 RepID=UPI001FB14658|nr:protoheme IX farnesyltransferase, mitochondrial [Impatiens glandulifera]
MWRNSRNFSLRLAFSPLSNPNPKSTFVFSGLSSFNYGVGIAGSVTRPEFYSATSTAKPISSGRLIEIPKINGVGTPKFASSAAGIIHASSASEASVSGLRSAANFARFYGRCYYELSKARLSMLVVATSGTGYILGSGSAIDYFGLCSTCAGTMMVAASANSLNQVFEVKNDAKMKRTSRRPLPSGRVSIPHAATWACGVGTAGTALLAIQANALTASLAASNLFLYAFVYTPLKQIHPINTWVGAVVGAIPPLLGWAAASGEVTLNAFVLPAALYFWQIPHFMALAYLCRDDYAAGGFKMFSFYDPSGRRTALVALRNCLYLLPLGYFAYDWGITSGWFCLESTLLALAITGTALSFYKNRTTENARRMFHGSLLYLPVFMSGLLAHRICSDEQLLDAQLSSSSKELVEEIDINRLRKPKHSSQSRPPVAYASAAPFPFLPAPEYAATF